MRRRQWPTFTKILWKLWENWDLTVQTPIWSQNRGMEGEFMTFKGTWWTFISHFSSLSTWGSQRTVEQEERLTSYLKQRMKSDELSWTIYTSKSLNSWVPLGFPFTWSWFALRFLTIIRQFSLTCALKSSPWSSRNFEERMAERRLYFHI